MTQNSNLGLIPSDSCLFSSLLTSLEHLNHLSARHDKTSFQPVVLVGDHPKVTKSCCSRVSNPYCSSPHNDSHRLSMAMSAGHSFLLALQRNRYIHSVVWQSHYN